MVEPGHARRSWWVRLPLATAATLFLSYPAAAPAPLLHAGEVRFLDFGRDSSLFFLARLKAGEVLHLTIDQRGLDVEMDVTTAAGASLQTVDLPFGSQVREDLWLAGTRDSEFRIEVKALDGRGRPRLEVLHLGQADARQQRRAEEFVRLWGRSTATGPARSALLEELARKADDPRLRILAAGSLGGTRDPQSSLRGADLALAQITPETETALIGQLHYKRGQALADLKQKDAAMISLRLASAAGRSCQDLAGAGAAEAALGTLAWLYAENDAAIRHFSAARDHFEAAFYPADARRQELWVARSLIRLGSSPEPLARLLRLLAASSAGPESDSGPWQGTLLREMGWWLMLEGQHTDAKAFLARAAELDPLQVESWHRLAMVQLRLGETKEAVASLRRAVEIGPSAAQRANIDATSCLIDLERGELDSARSFCEQAASDMKKMSLDGALPVVEAALARIEARLGHLENAERLAARASAAIESQRGEAGGVQQRLDFFAVRTAAPEVLVEVRLALAAARGLAWQRAALEASERTRARLLQDLLTSASPRDLGQATSANRYRRENELRQVLAIESRSQIHSLLYQQELASTSISKLTAALRELDRLRGQEGAPQPPLESPPLDLEAVQRELDQDAALLVYHLGPRDAYGWVLTREHLRGAPLGSSAKIRDFAAALYGQAAASTALSARAFSAWSEQLATLLYQPFAPELREAAQVVVVTPAELQPLPFAALPFPADSGQPLMASRSLVNLPSVAVLPFLRRHAAARPRAARLLAIVDDPVYDDDPRLPPAIRKPGPFQPLPDTAREARSLLDLFGSHGTARLTGFAANRNELLGGALSSFRILHFATHARTGQDPRGLVLSRYDAGGRRIEDVFGFPELASLSLDADLVVTTACSSALGEEVAGEGLLGLSQGFLAAGIPRLLLTLWPVRGTSARELVSRFYPRLLAGASPAEALRQAQQQMWQEGWNLHDWGAFALYGDWRGLPEIFPATNQHQGLARVDDQWRKDVPSAATSRGAVR